MNKHTNYYVNLLRMHNNKVKLTFRSLTKATNGITANSKETRQLITETLNKEEQAFSNNKKSKNQIKKRKT